MLSPTLLNQLDQKLDDLIHKVNVTESSSSLSESAEEEEVEEEEHILGFQDSFLAGVEEAEEAGAGPRFAENEELKLSELKGLVGRLRELGGQPTLTDALQILIKLTQTAELGSHDGRKVWAQVKAVVVHEVWPAVMRTCSQQACHFTPDDVQYTLYYMAKLHFTEDRALIRWLQEVAQKLLFSMSTFHVANIVWSLAELGQRGALPSPFVTYFMAHLGAANAFDCANFIYGCSVLGWDVPQDYLAVTQHFLSLTSTVANQHSRIVWSLANRIHAPPAELRDLLASFLRAGPTATQADISNILVALFAWHERELEQAGTDFAPSNTFLTLSDGSQLAITPYCARLLELFDSQDSASAVSCSNVLYCAYMLGVRDDEVANRIFDKFMVQQSQWTMQSVGQSLQWCSQCGHYSAVDEIYLESDLDSFVEFIHLHFVHAGESERALVIDALCGLLLPDDRRLRKVVQLYVDAHAQQIFRINTHDSRQRVAATLRQAHFPHEDLLAAIEAD